VRLASPEPERSTIKALMIAGESSSIDTRPIRCRYASMLGSAVSSNIPMGFQPSSHMGAGSRPVISRHAAPGPA
jgi:hypothetical protein